MQINSASLLKAGGVLVAVALLAGLLISQTAPADYRSEAVILPDWPRLNSEAALVLSKDNLTNIVARDNLYGRDRAKISPEALALRLRSSTLLIAAPGPDRSLGTLRIRVSAPDAAGAQRAASSIAQDFVSANAGSLVEKASLPARPDRPPFGAALRVALPIGILAGLLFVVVGRFHAWKTAALLGICGVALGAAAASVLPGSFQGLSVVSCRTTDPAAARNLANLATAPDLLASLVQRFHLYPGDSQPEHRLAQNLIVEPDLRPAGNPLTRTEKGSYDIRISFQYPDPTAAQLVTEAIAAHLTDADSQQRVGIANEVVAPAFVHAAPSVPLRPIFSIAGLLLGIVGGCVFRPKRSLPA